MEVVVVPLPLRQFCRLYQKCHKPIYRKTNNPDQTCSLGLESIFAGLGLGLELKLGLATYELGLGLGLGSLFSKSFFKSTLQSAPAERVFINGGNVLLYFTISHSSTVICCT